MARFSKSMAELHEELGVQLKALRSSAVAYDTGEEWEARRIATVIHILLHDGKRGTRSLLTLIEMRSSLKLQSTRSAGGINPPVTEGLIGRLESPLVTLRIEGGSSKYVPSLASGIRATTGTWMPVDEWWEQEVFSTLDGEEYSRRKIAQIVRDQDGGGHVDAGISDQVYWERSREGYSPTEAAGPTLGPALLGDAWKHRPNNVFAAILRQMAWELDVSFARLGL